MAKSYRKTIRSHKLDDGSQLCLTVTVQDGSVIDASLAKGRVAFARYKSKGPALARFESIVSCASIELPEAPLLLADRARLILEEPETTVARPVTLHLLAHLENALLLKSGKSHHHTNVPLGLIPQLSAEVLPLNEKELRTFLNRGMREVATKGKSKSWTRNRLQTFIRLVEHLEVREPLREYSVQARNILGGLIPITVSSETAAMGCGKLIE